MVRGRFANSLKLIVHVRPNYSFKRTAVTGRGTIMRYAAAAA